VYHTLLLPWTQRFCHNSRPSKISGLRRLVFARLTSPDCCRVFQFSNTAPTLLPWSQVARGIPGSVRFRLRSGVAKLCRNRIVDAGLHADNLVPIQLRPHCGRAFPLVRKKFGGVGYWWAARQPLQGVHVLNRGVARTLRATVDEQDSTIRKQGGSVLRVPLHVSRIRKL
jgi:hypothetical protein